MQTYGVNEATKNVFRIFESKDHLVLKFPLVPQNDSSLL